MPNFANPFNGNVDRKITKEELIQAIRLDIAGELEAIFVYDAHVQATDDPRAKKIIADIRDEEKAHVGELMTLLRILDPKEADLFEEGENEVRELLEELKDDSSDNSKDKGEKDEVKNNSVETVGSLIDG